MPKLPKTRLLSSMAVIMVLVAGTASCKATVEENPLTTTLPSTNPPVITTTAPPATTRPSPTTTEPAPTTIQPKPTTTKPVTTQPPVTATATPPRQPKPKLSQPLLLLRLRHTTRTVITAVIYWKATRKTSGRSTKASV